MLPTSSAAKLAALKQRSDDLFAADGIILAAAVGILVWAVIGLLAGWL